MLTNVYSAEGIIGRQRIIGLWIFTPLPADKATTSRSRSKQSVKCFKIDTLRNAHLCLIDLGVHATLSNLKIENKTRPSALGMSDPIWGPLIHIFVDEKKKCEG